MPFPNVETQFQPGQSGNPNGYSRGRRAVDHLLDLIAEKGCDKAIAQRWLQAILEGDFRYMQEYLNRRDGKPKEDPASGGDDGEDGKPKGITIPAHDPRYAAPQGGRKAPKRDRNGKSAKGTGHRRAGGDGEDVSDPGGDP